MRDCGRRTIFAIGDCECAITILAMRDWECGIKIDSLRGGEKRNGDGLLHDRSRSLEFSNAGLSITGHSKCVDFRVCQFKRFDELSRYVVVCKYESLE